MQDTLNTKSESSEEEIPSSSDTTPAIKIIQPTEAQTAQTASSDKQALGEQATETSPSKPASKLFNPAFSAIAFAQLFSLLGEAVLRFVLPLYLLNLTGSATLYGIVVACAFIPYIILTPIGGAMADRVNKKYIMAVLDLVMAGASVAYIVFAQTFDLVVLTIVILMVLYAAQSIYQPTIQASVPSVVARDRIVSATAIVTQISALTGLVGPVIGGLIFGFFGITPIVIVSSIAFVVSSVLIVVFVKIPHTKKKSSNRPFQTLKGDIKDAGRFLKTTPIMWKTILLATSVNLIAAAFIIVGSPYMITEVLGLSNQLMGIAEGALALGGLIGGIIVSVKPKYFPIQRAPMFLLGATFGFVPLALTMAFSSSALFSYGVILVSFSWTMAMCSIFSIVGISFLQLETPGDLIGKVIALTMSAAQCALPIGQLVYGIGFDNLPVPVLALIVICGMLVVSIIGLKTFRKAFR